MIKYLITILIFCGVAQGSLAQEPVEFYIDADYSINYAAADSIELGVRTALNEEGNLLGGIPVDIVPRDHRGNVRRARHTFDRYVESQTAIAVIGGLHSPPYLSHQSFLNDNAVLTLLPWSAAGPITRAEEGAENWIFRLSVDDRKAGAFLVRQALESGECRNIALVLLDTGWGRATEKNLRAALAKFGQTPQVVAYFPTTVGKAGAGRVAQTVATGESDCVILLANSGNGAEIVNALGARNPNLRIFSHWGITSETTFADHVPHAIRKSMRIQVLQTCGLKREAENSPILRAALAAAYPTVRPLGEIAASTGFIHGYDLTKIVLAAAKQAATTPEWQGDIKARRRALRAALIALEQPVDGILKQYHPPFVPYTPNTPDAHEALGLDDLCLAQFTGDGHLEDAN